MTDFSTAVSALTNQPAPGENQAHTSTPFPEFAAKRQLGAYDANYKVPPSTQIIHYVGDEDEVQAFKDAEADKLKPIVESNTAQANVTATGEDPEIVSLKAQIAAAQLKLDTQNKADADAQQKADLQAQLEGLRTQVQDTPEVAALKAQLADLTGGQDVSAAANAGKAPYEAPTA